MLADFAGIEAALTQQRDERTMTDQPARPSADPASLPTWWHKPIIWGGFLALLYLLRDFFLIGFLTFLICFIVRGLVRTLARRFAGGHENRWLELGLTLSIFLAFCLILYGLGRYFVPQFIRDGQSLLAEVQNTSPEQFQNVLLSNTVGEWQLRSQMGDPSDPRYQEAFRRFQAAGQNGEGLYATIPKLASRLQAKFEAGYDDAQILHLKTQSHKAVGKDMAFDRWLMQYYVPRRFASSRNQYIEAWDAESATSATAHDSTALQKQSDSTSLRDQLIRQKIYADIKSDPVALAQLKRQWARLETKQLWDQLRKSPKYQKHFETFYKQQRKSNPAAAPIEYRLFQKLTAAYPRGKGEFLAEVRQHLKKLEKTAQEYRHDFEAATRLQLGQQWWATSPAAAWLREQAKHDGPRILEAFVNWLEQALPEIVRIPIQVGTALVLAIFILVEWDRLKQGANSIRHTRLRPIYDDVAPGIVTLSKLIGKSFQGQAVIAAFNALLTLLALWLIGVEYKYVLSLVVFVLSFVPTIGVILSGIPICLVALSQPGGSMSMVLQVIGAIVLIHLIEGMVLSPRIIGKIGHLHPVLVIVILLVAEHFFGLWGLILGLPVAIYLIRVVLLQSPIPGIYDPIASAPPQQDAQSS